MSDPIRVAMWSGPRNISTAMMYSFDNRPDCYVSDEPLYANFLLSSGTPHPGADEIIESYDTDLLSIIEKLSGPVPGNKRLWYQKHMCHHVPKDFPLSWIDGFSNCFLIRDPREVILSLSKITDEVDLWSLGLPQQIKILEHVVETRGNIPPIIDSRDVLDDPKGILSTLCHEIGLEFHDSMISWRPGPRECDGNWAKFWYKSVWGSSGFEPYIPRTGEVSPHLLSVLEDAKGMYDSLWKLRITT